MHYSVHPSEASIHSIRKLVENSLKRNLPLSAAFIAERLTTLSSSSVADSVLYAKCHYHNEQPRRCLAILEQKGLLSAHIVKSLGHLLQNDGQHSTVSDISAGLSSPQQQQHHLDALYLAAQCLFKLDQFEDCASLLQPLLLVETTTDASAGYEYISRIKNNFGQHDPDEIHVMAGIYCLVGKCYDILDHRNAALNTLTLALRLDVACIEAAEFIIDHGLLNELGKRVLYENIAAQIHDDDSRSWLTSSYRLLLLNENPETVMDEFAALGQSVEVDAQQQQQGVQQPRIDGLKVAVAAASSNSAPHLARRALYCFERLGNVTDAYRLARQAYTFDPYDERGLSVYIASMVELQLKTELFYLGHELVNSFPKSAMSWYAVGSYYWCCVGKLDLAQKFLLKATKLDKRFCKAWILLGHVLSAQEESEQSISAYRTAARLLPGDHRPMTYLAQELQRAHHLAPALHMLTGALEASPLDCGLLNELAVIYVKQENFDAALALFERAIEQLDCEHNDTPVSDNDNKSPPVTSMSFTFSRVCAVEIFSNYATTLRKCERYEDALYWYDKCLATNSADATCYANVGFTFHLMQRFDEAVSSYHQALAIRPNFTFCSDMLSRAMEDMTYYPTVRCGINITNDANMYANITRLSNYSLGDDPDLAGVQVGGEVGRADENHVCGSSSSMLSAAESYTQIESRLSLSPAGVAWGTFNGLPQNTFHSDNNISTSRIEDSFVSQQTPEDNGGFLDDSF